MIITTFPPLQKEKKKKKKKQLARLMFVFFGLLNDE